MKAIDDPHGYHDMNGAWQRGAGPKTARQVRFCRFSLHFPFISRHFPSFWLIFGQKRLISGEKVDNPPKCKRPECAYLFHADPANNGGEYCCKACKAGGEAHDGHCHQLIASEELALQAANAGAREAAVLSTE